MTHNCHNLKYKKNTFDSSRYSLDKISLQLELRENARKFNDPKYVHDESDTTHQFQKYHGLIRRT